MANLIEWILEETEESEIVAVVIGKMGWDDFGKEGVPQYDSQPKGVILKWEEAKPWLNYEFDSGYGSPECNSIYVWTQNKILFIVEYDGSTSMYSVPRNPVNCMPEMPGS